MVGRFFRMESKMNTIEELIDYNRSDKKSIFYYRMKHLNFLICDLYVEIELTHSDMIELQRTFEYEKEFVTTNYE